jgi:hypothetical protein
MGPSLGSSRPVKEQGSYYAVDVEEAAARLQEAPNSQLPERANVREGR